MSIRDKNEEFFQDNVNLNQRNLKKNTRDCHEKFTNSIIQITTSNSAQYRNPDIKYNK